MTTQAPEARALTESALLAIHEALDLSSDPVDFFARADTISATPDNQLALPVSLGTPEPLNVSGNRAVDIDNAPLVHQYVGEKDRANSADARLWTYLAFGTYRSYMEWRWPLKATGSDSDAWKRRVRDRWLFHSGSVSRGRLIRHGIARLWWVAHLTYTPNAKHGIAKDDPYAYTREVFKSEDRLNAIFDREVGAILHIRAAILAHTAALGAKATDNHLRRVMRYLTVVHGYRDIGALDIEAATRLVKTAALRTEADAA